ncbi:MAG: hypothetical protein LBU85_09000 [Treponema sp.]|jgi:hypothetical protein|nr:hypothetical protein [Treponema sp.]
MITKETAVQIARRSEKLEQINRCLASIENLSAAEMELTFAFGEEGVVETFSITTDGAEKFLQKAKAHEEACLDELNAQALAEAQPQEVQN